MKGTVTKSSIILDKNHRLQDNFSTLFQNGNFQHADNLNAFSCLVLEICNKILLGALGIWLSLYQ